jgi:hypothetical protein
MSAPALGGKRSPLLPSTGWGRWTVGLGIAFLVLFGSFLVLVASGQRGGATIFSNLTLAVPGLLAAGCAAVALVTGLIAVIFSKERSPLVFVATIRRTRLLPVRRVLLPIGGRAVPDDDLRATPGGEVPPLAAGEGRVRSLGGRLRRLGAYGSSPNPSPRRRPKLAELKRHPSILNREDDGARRVDHLF